MASYQKVAIGYKRVVQFLGVKLCMGNKLKSNYEENT
jgi:hypothetical protein